MPGGGPVSVKPLVDFFVAFMASAVPVFGAAILLSLTVAGRELPRDPVDLALSPADEIRSSNHAKSAGTTGRQQIAPEGATSLSTLLESTESALVVDQPETNPEPDAGDEAALSRPNNEMNVASSSAPAMLAETEGSAPNGTDIIQPAQLIGRVEGNVSAGKPSETVPQLFGMAQKAASRPSKEPNVKAYGAGVYAALARHKPTAVERGSTTVMFAIGSSGALAHVRVGQSSGNTRVDQMALQMVRDAAPFPPPPNGASSYAIRIDFQ